MLARLALLTAALALLASAPAAAKQIVSAEVCGRDACNAVEKRTSRELIVDWGEQLPGPTRREPSYVVHIAVGDERGDVQETLENRWLPGAALLQGDDGTWFEAPADVQELLTRLTDGLEPFPAAKLPRDELARAPRRTTAARQPAGDGGGGVSALAVGAPAAAALGLAAVLARRRRHRAR